MSRVLTQAPTPRVPPPVAPPPLGPVGMARWAWRQLTSMRVALLLLFLLALAAIPGSVVPQRDSDPLAVGELAASNPELARWYERLGLFDVYSAPWFAAIYLALFVSLVGCIVPRSRQHWRAVRARPPAAPRALERLPAHRRSTLDAPPSEVLAAAHAVLRRRRYRVVRDGADGPDGAGGAASLAAEKGHLRESGNLVFHLALVGVLAAVAVGSLFGYRAQVLVVQGGGFANTVIQYDSLRTGALFDPADLPPFTLRLQRFTMDFADSGAQVGTPLDYDAYVRWQPSPDAPTQQQHIRVNEPLSTAGTLVHLLNPGYAPRLTVRDADGDVLFSGAVPFLPQDANFTSTGVLKVPVAAQPGRADAGADIGTETGADIGIEGLFLPTAVLDAAGPRSVFPEPRDPALFLTAWTGDLGLDDGIPQSVYRLDTSRMTQLRADGDLFRAALGVGESAQLPGGHGSVTFDGYTRWANFQVSRNAGKEVALVSVLCAIAGLTASLFVRRRRCWVRVAAAPGGRSVVEVAGLDRDAGGDLGTEVEQIETQVRAALQGSRPRPEGAP